MNNGSEFLIAEPCSNFGFIRYIYLHTNTVGKMYEATCFPPSYELISICINE